MNVPNKTIQNDDSVAEFIARLPDEQVREDSKTLVEMMAGISGHEAKMWGPGIIGFDTYHYKYESGREGDSQPLGFHPSKSKITIYLLDGTARHAELLAKLGKHTTSRACLYIRRLSDLDLVVLEQILKRSYSYIKLLDGRMHRAER